MTLKKLFEAMRVRLGFGSLSETRLSPAHGWLLREASVPRGNPATSK